MAGMSRIVVVVVTVLGALGATAAGAEPRHSGAILGLSVERDKLTVGEVGPWALRDGETVTIRRTFALTPDTRIVRVERRPQAAPGGWPGDFVEVPITAADLRPGDFVTVEVSGAGGRPAASKVSAVVPLAP